MSLTLDELPDALLIISFGGPRSSDEVVPFLRSVVRGRGVPEERLMKVAARYEQIGGRSPIVDATQALVEAVREHLAAHGPPLPVYLATRHGTPRLEETLTAMANPGSRF